MRWLPTSWSAPPRRSRAEPASTGCHAQGEAGGQRMRAERSADRPRDQALHQTAFGPKPDSTLREDGRHADRRIPSGRTGGSGRHRPHDVLAASAASVSGSAGARATQCRQPDPVAPSRACRLSRPVSPERFSHVLRPLHTKEKKAMSSMLRSAARIGATDLWAISPADGSHLSGAMMPLIRRTGADLFWARVVAVMALSRAPPRCFRRAPSDCR